MGSATEPLSLFIRWYIYAIHGFVAEIMFTATLEFIENRDWRLMGITSVWVLFVYGIFGLILEQLYFKLRTRCNFVVRGILYTLAIYTWEFCIGYILLCFHACPWDYSHYHYNFMGLITLEYFPLWFVGSLLLERLVVYSNFCLRVDKSGNRKVKSERQNPGKVE